MFLPVVLMREMGLPGFVSFAVPNIVGAAAMGWVLRSREQSLRLVQQHRRACVWFSLVTIVFHAYFAAWMIRHIAGPSAGVYVVAVFLAFWLLLHWRRGGEIAASVAALVVSVGVLAWAFARHDLPYLATPVEGTRLPAIDSFLLFPAWVLGFVCCPYLDLTFHNARQALGARQARVAFGVGFGVVFAAMLACTACYSGWLAIPFDRSRYPQVAIILAAHLITQSCLTCALHLRQISRVERRFPMKQFVAFSVLLLAAVCAGVWPRTGEEFNGISLGEYIYRGFLGFYGLVAPTYVWLCVLPPRRSVLRVATVIIIALPLYFLGFAGEVMPMMVPGVIVVVIAKLFP